MSQINAEHISKFNKQIRSFYDNPSTKEYIRAMSIYNDIEPLLTQDEFDDVHLQLITIYRYLIASEKQSKLNSESEKQSNLNSESEEEDPDQSAGKKRIKSKKYRKTKSRKMSKKSRKMKHKSRRH